MNLKNSLYFICIIRIVINGYTVSSGYNQSDANILGILVVSVLFGCKIGKMKVKRQETDEISDEQKMSILLGELMYNVLIAFSKPFISAIRFIIRFSPLGVFSLLCGTILQLEDPNDIFQSLSLYIISCIVGFIIQSVIALPLLR